MKKKIIIKKIVGGAKKILLLLVLKKCLNVSENQKFKLSGFKNISIKVI